MRQAALVLALWVACAAARATVGPGAPPSAGAYAAQMCVMVAAQGRQCGAVNLTVRNPEEWVLTVDDIRYRVRLKVGAQVDVFIFHGSMQIDEFTANGRWLGNSLEWFDQAKNTRYLVQLGARLEAAALAPAASAASTPN